MLKHEFIIIRADQAFRTPDTSFVVKFWHFTLALRCVILENNNEMGEGGFVSNIMWTIAWKLRNKRAGVSLILEYFHNYKR